MPFDIDWDGLASNTIARSDNSDPYGMIGYLCIEKDGLFGLGRISHCSCYGTIDGFERNSDGHIIMDWEGDLSSLREMLSKEYDPAMPDRVMSPYDYDYDHVTEVYRQITEWINSQTFENPA